MGAWASANVALLTAQVKWMSSPQFEARTGLFFKVCHLRLGASRLQVLGEKPKNIMNAIVSIAGKTGRIIAEEMGIPVYKKRDFVPELENVIRWGSTRTLTISGIELNKAEAIMRASNKAECRKFLAEK